MQPAVMYYGSKNESRRRVESSTREGNCSRRVHFCAIGQGHVCNNKKKKEEEKKEKRAKRKGEEKKNAFFNVHFSSLSLHPTLRVPRGVLRNTEAMIRQDVALCATPRYDARTCQ